MEQNNLYCIIIYYCELKLKLINILFLIKNEKRPIKKFKTEIQVK